MPFLDKLTPEECELLVSLPYRTGVWISQSDDTGGHEADEAEMQALKNIITGYTEDLLKSEFIEELMLATVGRQEKWTEWARHIDDILPDCEKALTLLAAHFDKKDIEAFKHTLLDIGVFVAQAFCEAGAGSPSLGFQLRQYRQYLFDCATALFKRQPLPHRSENENISQAEYEALEKLAATLNIKFET